MFREAVIAASLATAMPAVANAQAEPSQPVTIGMLDVYAPGVIGNDRKTQVTYREFTREDMQPGRWKGKNGHDHGETMATLMVNQIRSMNKDVPIKIYAANAME